jgi:hypothetical protein
LPALHNAPAQVTFKLEESPTMGYFFCVHDAAEFASWKSSIEKVFRKDRFERPALRTIKPTINTLAQVLACN